MAYVAGGFALLSAFATTFVFCGKAGKLGSLLLGVIGCIFSLAAAIILWLNASYWYSNQCKAAELMYEAGALDYDYCDLAYKAAICATISFVSSLLGSISWCCIPSVTWSCCGDPGVAGTQQPRGYGVQAPLLGGPGVNSAAPNLLQQQMGSGMLIQPGQPGQPPQQFQQHQQQPLPQQAHLQHQPAGLVQAAAGLPAAAAPSSSLAEFCAHLNYLASAPLRLSLPSAARAVTLTAALKSCLRCGTDATNKLEAFAAALAELGVEEVSELADITDADLASIGVNKVQIKRVRRVVPERKVETGQSRPASPTRAGAE